MNFYSKVQHNSPKRYNCTYKDHTLPFWEKGLEEIFTNLYSKQSSQIEKCSPGRLVLPCNKNHPSDIFQPKIGLSCYSNTMASNLYQITSIIPRSSKA